MSNSGNTVKLAIISLFLALALPAFAADPSAQKSPGKKENAARTEQMSPELKKDMADMYQKMADCMRTDKTLEQCQNDIAKDCPVVAKTGHCPLMEGIRPMMHNSMHHSKSHP